ncbi:MAG TPA: hypothetical protein VK638_58780 [Edaphobacter sp.]|nr:hypothetical protein [Edaphobacter sp.]
MLQTKTHQLSLPESAVVGQLYTYGRPGEDDRSQPRDSGCDSGRDFGRERDPIPPLEPANEYSDLMHDPAGNSGAVPGDKRDVWDRM